MRDHRDRIFGGFARESWVQAPNFYGSESCFLFSAQPELGVYRWVTHSAHRNVIVRCLHRVSRPSGHNKNFMYCNSGASSLPNGIGMGGQLEYFGFFLDDTLDKGHSQARYVIFILFFFFGTVMTITMTKAAG